MDWLSITDLIDIQIEQLIDANDGTVEQAKIEAKQLAEEISRRLAKTRLPASKRRIDI